MDLKLQSSLLEFDPKYVSLLNSYPSKHYKVYKIPKRTIGFRTIAQPTKSVKKIQKELVKILSNHLSIHKCATAYIKDKSIKDNAIKHVKSEYLLKLDLEDFFNSITPNVFFKAIKKQGIIPSEDEAKILEQFLFWNRSKRVNGKLVLSVGAPSSPFISNVIMYSFDKSMAEFCNQIGINYTRYADDLTFSSNAKGALFKHLEFVRRLLLKEFGTKIVLNESKTVFSSKGHNRHITGITISNNNRLSLGRDKKRYISALIHKFKLGLLSDEDIIHLHGLLAHAYHIEKSFLKRMSDKYSINTMNAIKNFSKGAENG
ncbi:retron St85 family RNA-directed DNA polymerase [Pseudoalteromonas sp. BZP1]|uniref:retron St85 family RNA-directed DNA polymerase n=1 Tax=unclassified Pseudoalteromonas TaxID=194690 RepID=UPI0032C4332A